MNNFFKDKEERSKKYRRTLTPREMEEIDEICPIISEAYFETYGYEFGELPNVWFTRMPSGEHIITVRPQREEEEGE